MPLVRQSDADAKFSEFAENRAVILSFHSNPLDEKLRFEGGPFEAVLRTIIAES